MTRDYDETLDGFLGYPARQEHQFLSGLTREINRPIPMPAPVKLPFHKTDPAEHLRRQLGAFIQRFERGLDADHEVGMWMTDATVLSTLWLHSIAACGPEHLELIGTNAAGERVHVMRHYTQPAISLIAVKKREPEQEPRRIGFMFSEQR